MQWILFITDRRVGFEYPPNTAKSLSSLSVGADSALSEVVSWVRQEAAAHNDAFVRLLIYSHALGVPGSMPAPDPDGAGQPPSVDTVVAGGLLLCEEGVSLANLETFQPLNGLLDWIELHACEAAKTNPGYEGNVGDGQLFCSRLAQLTGASVQASDADQVVTFNLDASGVVQPYWTGTVYTFGPGGNVTNTQRAADVPPVSFD